MGRQNRVISAQPQYEEVPAWNILVRGIEAPRWMVVLGALLATTSLIVVDSATGSDAHVLLGAFVIVVAVTWAGQTYEAAAIGVTILLIWAAIDFSAAAASQVMLATLSGTILLGIGIVLTRTFRSLVLDLDDATRRDSLTGLLNTRALQEIAERARANARKTGKPISIAFLDLDEFKQVNDIHGHVVGDNVLTALGEVISTTIRSTDIAGRVGGDEFTLILPDTDLFEAATVLKRIRQRVAVRTDIPFVTATTGYVTFRCPPRSVEEMIHMADDLMYSGKRKDSSRGRMIGRVVDGDDRHEDVEPVPAVTIVDTDRVPIASELTAS